jgi:hypothetical protein
MSILLLGDSHTNIFYDQNVNVFPLNKCNLDLFTNKRFLDDLDHDLWSHLTPWLENNRESKLIVTSGEIDLRAHCWRHLPRHYTEKSDIVKFIFNLTENFYRKLLDISEKYQLDRIVVWGSPICGEKAQYNSQYPFVGNSKTRNILTHIWNKEFIRLIERDNVISFSTAFYNFLERNYQTSNNAPSHDGVHWHNSLSSVFWNNFVIPALDNKGIFLNYLNYNLMYYDNFDLKETLSDGNYKYDTWAKTEQLSVKVDSKVINVANNSYTYVKAENRNWLPKTYHELSLDKI